MDQRVVAEEVDTIGISTRGARLQLQDQVVVRVAFIVPVRTSISVSPKELRGHPVPGIAQDIPDLCLRELTVAPTRAHGPTVATG